MVLQILLRCLADSILALDHALVTFPTSCSSSSRGSLGCRLKPEGRCKPRRVGLGHSSPKSSRHRPLPVQPEGRCKPRWVGLGHSSSNSSSPRSSRRRPLPVAGPRHLVRPNLNNRSRLRRWAMVAPRHNSSSSSSSRTRSRRRIPSSLGSSRSRSSRSLPRRSRYTLSSNKHTRNNRDINSSRSRSRSSWRSPRKSLQKACMPNSLPSNPSRHMLRQPHLQVSNNRRRRSPSSSISSSTGTSRPPKLNQSRLLWRHSRQHRRCSNSRWRQPRPCSNQPPRLLCRRWQQRRSLPRHR